MANDQEYLPQISSTNQQLDKLMKWNVDKRVECRLEGTGFDTYLKYARLTVKHDFAMLNAILACYKKGRFIFSKWKYVLGLEDVLRITGLPIDGNPVTGSNLDSRELAWKIFGIVEYNKGTKCSLSWLKSNFEIVPPQLDGKEIDKYVIAYMLYLLGACILPDKSRDKVCLMYLHTLENVDNVKNYAFGAAMLAHLQNAIEGFSESPKSKRFCGDAAFLTVAIMEYIPELAYKLMKRNNFAKPDKFPLLIGWGEVYKQRLESKYRASMEEYVDVLKNIEEVTWQPYARLTESFLPDWLKPQLIMRLSRTVMICFNYVAYHRPDKCIKKFGFRKVDLSACGKVKRHQTKAMSGPEQVDYSTKQYVLDWECRHIYLIQCIDVLPNSPTPDLDEPNPNSFAMRSSTTPEDAPAPGQTATPASSAFMATPFGHMPTPSLIEKDGWSEAQVNIEDEEVQTSEAQVRTSQAQACITQITQAVQTPPSQLVFSVIDQEAEPSTLPWPVLQHSSTADPSISHQASPSCNPPLAASQDQQSAAAPAELAEAAKPPVINSLPSIATNSESEDNPSSQSPQLQTPIGWPPNGKLTFNWVRCLMSVFDWASRHLEPTQLPDVFPVEVFDSLVLCASKILHKEANCVTIDNLAPESRVIVVGDLHGQLHDLLFLLHDAGFPSENRFFVFNGDYVDRGAWGLESFLILLAWKVFMPKRVYLLRGNHESKYCTSVYGFKNEVLTKYGDRCKHVYCKCLGCFKDLPLASIIGKHVYTAHGGIFRHMPVMPKKSRGKKRHKIGFNPDPNSLSLGSVEELNKARRSVLDPPWEGPNLIPGDVLWSDPSMTYGLSLNTERGIGLLWGPDCTEAFLKKFQLKLIIRSHEGPDAREKRPGLGGMDEGYTIDHIVESGKLITLFSAPDYPQFQGTNERYKNKGAYIILEPPNFDDPVFHSFEAITPRPKANPFYNFEEVIDSDEELDFTSMVTSP
ncbi:unnamed protein product [Prunus brigantina]